MKVRKKIIFLCECGCGIEVKASRKIFNRFVVGHNTRGKKYKHTKEIKKKIGRANKGKKRSEQQKKDISKKVKELWQDEEYRNKMVTSSKKYWSRKRSRKRMQKATNKRFENEEERKKISDTLKLYYEKNPGILAGENNPCYGRKLSENHKMAILKGISIPCSTNKKIKLSCIMQGITEEQWDGFIGGQDYCDIWRDKEYKEDILKRDNCKCQNPECYNNSKRLTRHHINYDKKDCKPDNLITLCNGCNSRANYNRDYWESFYKNKIIEGGKRKCC